MDIKVEVAIIGAGTAGLYALSQVKKKTDDFILINSGPYGTTCARVGCMPSKSLIHISEYYHDKKHFDKSGISNGESLKVSLPEVFQRVREHRDFLTGHNIKSVQRYGDKVLDGTAEFIDKHTLRVGDDTITAKQIIIATGSTPIFDSAWEAFKDDILTTDEIFEQEDLPETLGILGLGVIGLELGQALARLGVKVTAIQSSEFIGGLSDPQINAIMIEEVQKEFDICFGHKATLSKVNDKIKITAGDKEILVDKVLASIGRKPNLSSLKLKNIGIKLDKRGMPSFDKNTMQIEEYPIYLAGDVTGDNPLQHEAADEGRIAGYNAVHKTQKFKRKTPLSIVFSDPQIAFVGVEYNAIKDDKNVIIGSFDYSKQQRARLMNKHKGIAKIYVQKSDGKLLGAQIAAPQGENLAHHLAWAIQQEMTVHDMLELPFYHPTVEEGLFMMLLSCVKQLDIKKEGVLELTKLD